MPSPDRVGRFAGQRPAFRWAGLLLGRLPRWAGRLLTRARPWAVSAWAAARLSAWAGLVSSGPRARVWLARPLACRALMGQLVAAGRTIVEMFFKNWFLSLTCKIDIKWYRSPKIMKLVLLVS